MSAFPWAPPGLLVWRLDRKTRASTWDSGKGAEITGGRWNPKGFPIIYTSIDPATSLLELAVHKTFNALDAVPHVISRIEILDPSLVRVIDPSEIPNPNWLRPGTPSHAQQQFGKELVLKHPFVAIPSAVLPMSWNVVFNPLTASGHYSLRSQTDLALDTRLNPPKP